MKRALAAALGLALALVAGEGLARLLRGGDAALFPRHHTSYRYGPYTIRGIRAKAQFWQTSADGSWKFDTNSRGFRGTKDFPYAKPAGTLRVLSLGDSHTQGYEVSHDAAYPSVLERALKDRGTEAEVINTGVSGFGTAEELVLLEHEGVKYAPDAVTLGFFANDFEDNVNAGLFGLDERNRLVEKKHEHIPGVRIQDAVYAVPGAQWLSGNSHLYSLVFSGLWNALKARARGDRAVAADDSVPTARVELAAALIERMHRFCADRGIRLIVIDIPATAEAGRWRASLPAALAARLDEAGIEFVDSRKLLAASDGKAQVHRRRGYRHITEHTHALIGAELGRRLARRELVQRKARR